MVCVTWIDYFSEFEFYMFYLTQKSEQNGRKSEPLEI